MNQKLAILILASVFFLTGKTYSQDPIFKPFRVDVAGLFDLSLDQESGNGGGFAIEPRYGVNDNLVVGVRFEGVYLNNSNTSVSLSGVDTDNSKIYGVLFTGDCYLGYEVVRPFVGLGMGIFTMKTKDVSVGWTDVDVGTHSINRFGFSPRVGVNIKHLKLAAIFNITGKDIPSYVGFQAGIEIGGGYN